MNTLDNLSMSSSIVGNYTGLTKKMYKLTLYKYVPHFLKWRFWMDHRRTLTSTRSRSDKYVVNDSKFYQKLPEATTASPTTEPGQVTSGCTICCGAHKRLHPERRRHPEQNRPRPKRPRSTACFHIIFDMLDDLKENGVYDKSNIIIMSDHGDKDQAQWGTLLYKPAGSTGAYNDEQRPGLLPGHPRHPRPPSPVETCPTHGTGKHLGRHQGGRDPHP